MSLMIDIQNKDIHMTNTDTNMSNQTKTKHKHTNKKINKNTLISYNYFKQHFLDTSNTILNKTPFTYKSQLVDTLKHLNIVFKQNEKKKELENILINTFLMILEYDNNITLLKIKKIQKQWKHTLRFKSIMLYGPGFVDKTLCKNTEDCFTMESIENVPDKFFFSIKDVRNSIFFFDIRTFNKLVKTKSKNPFTREPFSTESLTTFKSRKQFMKTKKIPLIYPEEEEYIKNLTPTQLVQNKLFEVFQTIDELNVIAEGTQIQWFNDLNIIQLKQLYKVLEDVWSYRANLSDAQKTEIVPSNNMFVYSVNYIYNQFDIIKIQNIVLQEMNKLVTSSSDNSHRNTGAYYILIALTEISLECAEAMPWLRQY